MDDGVIDQAAVQGSATAIASQVGAARLQAHMAALMAYSPRVAAGPNEKLAA